MPSKTSPSASRSHCSRPQGCSPTSWAARARTSSVASSSRAGKTTASSMSPIERWSFTLKVVRRSTSSPHRSMRTGASAVDGYTSTIEPAAGHLARGARPGPRAGSRGPRAGRAARRGRAGRRGARSPARRPRRAGRGAAGAPGPRPRSTRGAALGLAEPPQHAQAPAHRLDARAHPLERAGSPRPGTARRRRRRGTRPGRRPGARPRCRWAWRRGSGAAVGGGAARQPGDGDGPGRLGHGQHGVGAPAHQRERGFVAQERGREARLDIGGLFTGRVVTGGARHRARRGRAGGHDARLPGALGGSSEAEPAQAL